MRFQLFSARDSIILSALYAIVRSSVCPSVVCLSHRWISQKTVS